jgi:hypothetical protein
MHRLVHELPQPYFSHNHEIFLEFGIIVMFMDYDVCIKKDLEVHNFFKRLSSLLDLEYLRLHSLIGFVNKIVK